MGSAERVGVIRLNDRPVFDSSVKEIGHTTGPQPGEKRVRDDLAVII